MSGEVAPRWEIIFDEIRRGGGGQAARYAVLVRPDQKLLGILCPPPGSISPELIAETEHLVPAGERRYIAVIAATQFSPDSGADVVQPGSADFNAVGEAIPFCGLLLGLAQIGHCVWIFDGRPSSLAAGCSGADMLIVDSAAGGHISRKVLDLLPPVMRSGNILIYDREVGGLTVYRKEGLAADRFEFN